TYLLDGETVSRPALHDDDFEVGQRLAIDAPQRVIDEVAIVEAGNDDRDEWKVGRPGLGPDDAPIPQAFDGSGGFLGSQCEPFSDSAHCPGRLLDHKLDRAPADALSGSAYRFDRCPVRLWNQSLGNLPRQASGVR